MALDWRAESLRISLFSNGASSVTDEDWKSLSGLSDSYNRQTVPGGHIFSGNIEQGQLSFSGINKRVDIILSTLPPKIAPSEVQVPTIGGWRAAVEKFFMFTSAWMVTVGFPVIRIAFGAVALLPTANARDSYLVLKRLLRSVSVEPEMRGFFSVSIGLQTVSQ